MTMAQEAETEQVHRAAASAADALWQRNAVAARAGSSQLCHTPTDGAAAYVRPVLSNKTGAITYFVATDEDMRRSQVVH